MKQSLPKILNSGASEKTILRAVYDAVDDYEKGFHHKKYVKEYLRYIVHYLFHHTPASRENFFGDFALFTGISHRHPFYDTSVDLLAREAADEAGDDEILGNAVETLSHLTEKDTEEMTEFLYHILDKATDIPVNVRYQYFGMIRAYRLDHMQSDTPLTLDRQKIELPMSDTAEDATDKKHRTPADNFLRKYTPEKIHQYLDRYIVGQEDAKRSVSLAVYNHYLRIAHPDTRLIKPNVLMIGPTGCGKTEIMRRLKQIINVPLVITDFSSVVATPWKGRNKEEALSELLMRADMNKESAEQGIVFIDEFDKTASGRALLRERGNVQDELQGQLLGMFEGTTVDVPSPMDRDKIITMDTTNILFICAGAFEGLDKVVQADRKETDTQSFGLPFVNKDLPVTGKTLEIKHLISYGYKSELIGRFGEICVLHPLSRDDLRKIFDGVQDSIYERYCNEFLYGAGKKLLFDDDAIEALIDRMEKMSIGARGLNSLMHDILSDALYEAPGKPEYNTVRVTRETVLNDAPVEFIRET